MATPPNFIDLARSQRSAVFNKLSFNNVVSNGAPTSNDTAAVIPSSEAAPIQPGYTTTIRTTYPKAVLAEDFAAIVVQHSYKHCVDMHPAVF